MFLGFGVLTLPPPKSGYLRRIGCSVLQQCQHWRATLWCRFLAHCVQHTTSDVDLLCCQCCHETSGKSSRSRVDWCAGKLCPPIPDLWHFSTRQQHNAFKQLKHVYVMSMWAWCHWRSETSHSTFIDVVIVSHRQTNWRNCYVCCATHASQSLSYAVVSCAIVARNGLQFLHAINAWNNCRLSNGMENIHEAKMLQTMTQFAGMTWHSKTDTQNTGINCIVH